MEMHYNCTMCTIIYCQLVVMPSEKWFVIQGEINHREISVTYL